MNPLLKLGLPGAEITLSDQNRSIKPKEILITRDARLASGKLVRDEIARKKGWTIEWKALPHTSAKTGDGYAGRNELKTEVDRASVLSLKIENQAGNYTTYAVLVTKYEETLISRTTDAWRYNISLELEEQ